MSNLRDRIMTALAKPLPTDSYDLSDYVFNPWDDVVSGISGHYAKFMDDCFVEALEAIARWTHADFFAKRGEFGEAVMYILAGHGLTEYGTSPRFAWPDPSIADLWVSLIGKWKAYSRIHWGEDD